MMMRHRKNKSARFGRSWWMDTAQTLFWVMLVTLLAWVYADMEFTDSRKITLTLEFNVGQASDKVELLSGSEHKISFVISGSRSSLDSLRREFSAQNLRIPFDVHSLGLEVGTRQSIPTLSLLKKALEQTGLDTRGIAIKDVSPATTDVQLDKVLLLKIPVRLEYQGDAEIKLHQQKVTVRISESKWKEVEKVLDGALPEFRTKIVDLRKGTPGEWVSVTAKIDPVLGSGENKISVIPIKTSITFKAKIHEQIEEKTFDVSVQILSPPTWYEGKDDTWQQYVLVRPEGDTSWRPKLTVKGTPAAIQTIKAGDIRAYIRLQESDKKETSSWLTRKITVDFPLGTQLELVGDVPEAKFRLRKRKESTPDNN